MTTEEILYALASERPNAFEQVAEHFHKLEAKLRHLEAQIAAAEELARAAQTFGHAVEAKLRVDSARLNMYEKLKAYRNAGKDKV